MKIKSISLIWLATIILAASSLLLSQGSGTPSNLRVITDANGYLLASSAVQTAPYTTSTFSNTRLKTDSNGNLLIASSGGMAPVDATYITQTANTTLTAEQALASLSSGIMRVATTTGVVTSLTDSAGIATNISDETGSGVLVFGTTPTFTTSTILNRLALATTSTDGHLLQNTTTATMAVPVQISPRVRWCGTAFNSSGGTSSETDCFFVENLPATVSGTTTALWKLGVSINGAGATYPLTISNAGNAVALGSFQATNNVDFGGNLRGGAASTDVVYLKTTPTITSGFSTTTPSIAGTASSFAVTIAATPGVTGTVAFNGTYSNVPSCHATNTITNNLIQAVPTTTLVVLNGVWVANDIIRVICIGY